MPICCCLVPLPPLVKLGLRDLPPDAFYRSAKELRLTGGVYTVANTERDFGTKNGLLLGIEQPITERFTLVADWTSGKNRFGYSNVGFNYGIKKSQNLTVAYTFGNSGRGNNYLSLFYGFNF